LHSAKKNEVDLRRPVNCRASFPNGSKLDATRDMQTQITGAWRAIYHAPTDFESIEDALGLEPHYIRTKLSHWTPANLDIAPTAR
jgi:hypothetical protein